MKKTISAILAMAMTLTGIAAGAVSGADEQIHPQSAFTPITAAQWAGGIRMGWNLGNTLDAYGSGTGETGGFPWAINGRSRYKDLTPAELETAWIGAENITTKELIQAISDAGFNAIRIPVSWHKALDKDSNIRKDWMDHVEKIVGWAMDCDMYVILNTHHDEDLFKFRNSNTASSIAVFGKIWQQIAERFRDYGEKLAFEGLNEPRTKGSAAEWMGGTAEERANVNKHNQAFVNTVRASGGNNAERVLIITTYAASAEKAAQEGLTIPSDTAEDKLVVSIHMYAPWEFALLLGDNRARSTWSKNSSTDTNPIKNPIDTAHNLFVSKGIPVIIGEMGAVNRNAAANVTARTAWAEYFVSYAASKDIACFWWDNNDSGVSYQYQDGNWAETFGIINRRTREWTHKYIADAMAKGAESRPVYVHEPSPGPSPLPEPGPGPSPSPEPGPGPSPSPEPGPSPSPSPEPPITLPPVDEAAVAGFVTRLYENVLGRPPEKSGLDTWVQRLSDKEYTGSEIAFGFYFSVEFLTKDISNEEFVDNLYATMMDRAGEEEGRAAWIDRLGSGMTRIDALSGFLESPEFAARCASAGIAAGDYKPQPDEAVRAFVARLYVLCLDRPPEAYGLVEWTDRLQGGLLSGSGAAHGIFFSEEFQDKNLSDEVFIEKLYNAMMGRPSDEYGKNEWLARMAAGTDGLSNRQVFEGFAASPEFGAICKVYGIKP